LTGKTYFFGIYKHLFLIVQRHATDCAVLTLILSGRENMAVCLISNQVKRVYTGQNFRVTFRVIKSA